ncbi:MAG: Mu-like prophage major head subunit gpT family protein [Aeromonas veronii]
MIINRENLNAYLTEMKDAFVLGAADVSTDWEKIATRIPSNGGKNTYDWLGRWPKLRKWAGAKVINNIKANGYSIENEDFEATVSVPRNDLEDGKGALYTSLMEQAGQSAKEFPDDLVFGLVNLAFTEKCYDGRPMIDDAHPVGNGPTTQSNKGTMPLSADSLDAADASLGYARANIRQRKDAEGKPMNFTPNLLMVGPQLENTARNLLVLEKFKDGTPNPYKGAFELLVSNLIEDPDQWFLMCTTKKLKPFIFQPRKDPEVISTGLASPEVFNLGEYHFSVEARGNAGFGFWQMIFGSTGKG